MNEYNKEWDDERHENIDEEFKSVWDKLKTLDNRLWAIIVLQLILLVSIGGVLLKLI